MKRAKRAILAVMTGMASTFMAAAAMAVEQTPAAGPPRKSVVGSLMYSMWGTYPGLAKRLEALSSFIDAMSKTARQKYHAGLDIAVLPETAVNGEVRGSAKDTAVPLEGAVLDTLGAAARRNKTYVAVPLYLAEDAAKTRLYNACALLDRQGKMAGIYRKVHPVASQQTDRLEGGVLPGKDFPVFTCDFGKVGVQICYDMFFDDGWAALARKGAELVIWPTQSPQIIGAQCRARRHHYYLLSSTWRNNISLVDPTGAVIAQQLKEPGLLVEQIDLSYVLLDWQPQLRNGAALTDRYGKAVGYRYSEAEDRGIFWSNDPRQPVMEMVRALGLELPADSLNRNRRLQDHLRGGPPGSE
jgi:predicted amidohydrolase